MGNRGTAQTGEGSKGWQHNMTRICRVSTIFADSALFFFAEEGEACGGEVEEAGEGRTHQGQGPGEVQKHQLITHHKQVTTHKVKSSKVPMV